MSTVMVEIGSVIKDKFEVLLLSAVRQGDVKLLESHLSTVANPNSYLNRLYDEADDQKCTILMIACLNQDENMIQMLLRCFKPDLEILNAIRFEDVNTSEQMYFNISVLWLATAMNNFELVKLFVEHGANVNHTTKTNSTPLRCACYHGNIDMTRYLIENGGDIHIAKENNETNLKISVWYKRSEMVTYLVNELNCDVNVCDNVLRSPLYDAVYRESLELTQFLLTHGARNFRSTHDQMSPLMWAAEKKRLDIMEAIYPYCSLMEQIEAEELLGSAFVCFQHDVRDIEQSFTHYHRALELRTTHDLPKALEATSMDIFDHRQECQTLKQLEEIRSNPDRIYIEALLVRERLLGPTCEEYLDSLFYRGATLADNKQYLHAADFWMYEFSLRQQHTLSIHPDRLRQTVSLASVMVVKSLLIPIETFVKITTVIIDELEHNKKGIDFNMHTLLFLITIISRFLTTAVISATNRGAFHHHLRTLLRRQYPTTEYGLSLLHLSLDHQTLANERRISRICQYPCVHTTRLLLQCSVDVNAIDAVRNTPLHVFAGNGSTFDESILTLLCDAGAHLDCVNALGEMPIDVASDSTVKQLFKRRMKLSLKCLCARFIQKNNVPFHERIATSLVNFVEIH